MKAKIQNDRNWEETVNIERLSEIKAEPLGKRHCPVNHGDVVKIFRDTLAGRNIETREQKGMLSNDGLKYIYVADVKSDFDDLTLTAGFINYNDRSKSFTVVMGERVFVCSNECVSHQLDDLRRKHTNNVLQDIREKMTLGIDRFMQFSDKRQRDIKLLKDHSFNDKELGKTILSFHRDGELSNTNIDRIIVEYDNPTYEEFNGRSAWNFHNACTHVFQHKVADPLARIRLQNKMNNFIHSAINVDPIDIEPTNSYNLGDID